MKKLWLESVHAWNRLCLWQAEIETDSAAKIALEADEEMTRAAKVLAENTRKLLEARNRVMLSGYKVSRYERLLSLGVKP